MNLTAKWMSGVQGFGPEASFVANVILTQHSKPAMKLRNALYLLNRGYELRTAQFSIDTLLVNGQQVPFSSLNDLDAVLDIVNPALPHVRYAPEEL